MPVLPASRTRTIEVEVPNNESAEKAIRVACAAMVTGHEIAVIPIPKGIPAENVPYVNAQVQAIYLDFEKRCLEDAQRGRRSDPFAATPSTRAQVRAEAVKV